MRGGDGTDDGQAQAHAAAVVGAVSAEPAERLEQGRDVLRRDALARVADDERGLVRDRYFYLCPAARANARSKKGASNVDPAPLSVMSVLLAAAAVVPGAGEEVLVLLVVVVVQAARASAMIAAPALRVLVRVR